LLIIAADSSPTSAWTTSKPRFAPRRSSPSSSRAAATGSCD
jgi:hypothetical protein